MIASKTRMGGNIHLLLGTLLLSACMSMQKSPINTQAIDTRYLPSPDIQLVIDGLGPCTDAGDRTLRLKSGEPVNILVHGCYASAGRFRALAQVFAFQGQQAICYNYDDRASLAVVARDLRQSLDSLAGLTGHPEITLIGHSQGGLIARHALTTGIAETSDLNQTRQQLITLSAPFSGIRAADHCASHTARIISLGLVIPICMAISGDKWLEITHASDFIRRPGRLHPSVEEHLLIATDEAGSCRTRTDDQCREDDYVFSLAEQKLPPTLTSPLVRQITLKAGHTEIVGIGEHIPEVLIRTLQEEGILGKPEPARMSAYDNLLKTLYLSEWGRTATRNLNHVPARIHSD
ncbi:MAG: alpha/beta hydrolase [Candidatus Thiodiazotropha sp. (ex Monitilora ramsayi)]|nr:alpha/beta hydrolase [Candidatus Thiodiazotropha sp. (ex Monitilora ramsayi)]